MHQPWTIFFSPAAIDGKKAGIKLYAQMLLIAGGSYPLDPAIIMQFKRLRDHLVDWNATASLHEVFVKLIALIVTRGG